MGDLCWGLWAGSLGQLTHEVPLLGGALGEPRGALVPGQGLPVMTILLLEMLRSSPSWVALSNSQTSLGLVPPQVVTGIVRSGLKV